MRCWHCNAPIQIVSDGWMCTECGENGANTTPVDTVDEAMIKKRPLVTEPDSLYRKERKMIDMLNSMARRRWRHD